MEASNCKFDKASLAPMVRNPELLCLHQPGTPGFMLADYYIMLELVLPYSLSMKSKKNDIAIWTETMGTLSPCGRMLDV